MNLFPLTVGNTNSYSSRFFQCAQVSKPARWRWGGRRGGSRPPRSWILLLLTSLERLLCTPWSVVHHWVGLRERRMDCQFQHYRTRTSWNIFGKLVGTALSMPGTHPTSAPPRLPTLNIEKWAEAPPTAPINPIQLLILQRTLAR